MLIKRLMVLSGLLFAMGALPCALAREHGEGAMEGAGHHMAHQMSDDRVSLGLPPRMKLHQLANMRSHVEAIRAVVGLIAQGDFDKASEIAHTKLGLTDRMAEMCGRFGNEQFRTLGLAFHTSGDALGETLKTQDVEASLQALHTTMGYCVQCHATFRQ